MKAYERGLRAERARAELRSGHSVTEAIYEAGYGSPRAFYEHGALRLGMNPSKYADGGPGHEIAYAMVTTWIGKVLVATTMRGVCAVKIGEGRSPLIRDLEAEFPKACIVENGDDLSSITAVVKALAGGRASEQLPIDVEGTAFQMKVWEALQQIPRAVAVSYADVARTIGHPKSARAVANACAANAVALVVPCHRVVRADGSSGGYRWGRERKEALLRSEQ